MAMYKGPVINTEWLRPTHHQATEAASDGSHWLLGTLLILLGCIAWSAFYVLQSITIKKYPAEMSLSSLICLAGTVQSLGIVTSGVTYYVQGIVMKKRGPVFVTAFNPLCMIIVTVLGVSLLGETLNLGSKDYLSPDQLPVVTDEKNYIQDVTTTQIEAANSNNNSTNNNEEM
ncbi:hypothetical protein ACFE04_020142 [Oxalis oulophora]